MAYLINEKTKEHRALSVSDVIGDTLPPGEWKVVECDNDGWISWNGDSECPLPDRSIVDLKYDTGRVYTGARPGPLTLWQSIAAYRPVFDRPTRSTTMEPNLAEQIVAAATNQEVTERVFNVNNTPAFREAVERLLVCRNSLEILNNLDEIVDREGNSVDMRVIDRARVACGLPTAIDEDIADAQARLAQLKTQREEMLR